jgi:hypothetical protein
MKPTTSLDYLDVFISDLSFQYPEKLLQLNEYIEYKVSLNYFIINNSIDIHTFNPTVFRKYVQSLHRDGRK